MNPNDLPSTAARLSALGFPDYYALSIARVTRELSRQPLFAAQQQTVKSTQKSIFESD